MKTTQFPSVPIAIDSLLIGVAANVIAGSVLAQPQPPSLTVNISGLHSQKGDVVVCLWRNQDQGFPICAKDAAQSLSVPASAPSVSVVFQGLPPGDYAVSAFHDEDKDGKLKRGLMGRPSEGIAFSNMPQGSPGAQGKRPQIRPPSFERSKLAVNGATTVSMSFLYL
jgi:uncharacterized protein (DUF2141 family)